MSDVTKMADQRAPRIDPSTETTIKLALWNLIKNLQQLAEYLMKKETAKFQTESSVACLFTP